MKSTTWRRTYWMGAGILLVTVGIGLSATGRGKAATKLASPPLPEVGVIQVEGEHVATYREYPARTYARDLVEVRGRVDGYVDRRTFDIGSDVRADQVLYVLDVRPYEAEGERARGAPAQATADVAQAEAALLKARQDVARLEPLVKEEASPKQDLDNALAARQAAEATMRSRKATVEATRAILRTADLNLEYATIRAPIGGRIGDSLLQVGGLVTKTSTQPLTTIVPLDPVWVRFQVSEAELRLPIAALIGFHVEEIGGGHAVASLQSGPQHANPMGTLHDSTFTSFARFGRRCCAPTRALSIEAGTSVRARPEISVPFWASRRPPGEA